MRRQMNKIERRSGNADWKFSYSDTFNKSYSGEHSFGKTFYITDNSFFGGTRIKSTSNNNSFSRTL